MKQVFEIHSFYFFPSKVALFFWVILDPVMEPKQEQDWWLSVLQEKQLKEQQKL